MSEVNRKSKGHGEVKGQQQITLEYLVLITKRLPEKLSEEDWSKEEELLEWFGTHYNNERKFLQNKERQLFISLFENIVKLRLCNSDWIKNTSHKSISRYLICLRILMRDFNFQKKFMELDGVKSLAGLLKMATEKYLYFGEDCFLTDVLNNISSIFQKLANVPIYRENLVSNELYKHAIALLNASNTFILHCALHILIDLSEYSQVGESFLSLHATETIVRIIQEYDDHSQVKAADLLRILCSKSEIRSQLIMYDCLPILLSVLHDGNQCILLWHIVWILVLLCKDPIHTTEIRLMGGIPLLLNLLQDDRTLTMQRHEVSSANMRSGRTPHLLTADANKVSTATNEMLLENILKLKTVCCTALSELGLDDHNTETIVVGNGVFIIAKLILPQEVPENCRPAALQLQRSAFRALRFLFSMERNRRLFKRLFQMEMFQMFIDIGHYVRDHERYKPVVDCLNAMPEEDIDSVKENIEELNQNKTPRRFIKQEYAVMDLLGSGAFGHVYKVKKNNEEKALALKEVSAFIGGKEPKTGRNKEKKRQIDEIVHELTIIREQLRHPNIVRYYKTFQENDKLYIEMELIEGASLQEHFNSLKEKGETGMGEVRIWRVLIQLCLALRYLHKEKNIVHRDLTPGNIMLGENDHVTVTDFGLAKQKQDESKLYSVVGTLLYSCPEIIKSEPYGEKADIWALGCILYQMATLSPPFPSDNMLSLAKKIVEAKFDPVPEDEEYSSLINYTVTKCLTIEPEHRPDIIGVTSLIAAPMLRYTDRVTMLYHTCERRLEKERKRTQRNYHEARENMRNYRSLFQASQENSNRISRNFSTSNIHTFTQQEKVISFNPTVSSPAMLTPTTPPNGRLSSGDATSPGSDVFSDGSSSGSNSYHDNVPDSKMLPHPPRSRPNSIRMDDSGGKGDLPCRALSFDISEQGLARDALLSRVGTASRGRPGSASNAGMLTISPRKVRQINDPVQTMLHQLHKIIFVDQLPPTTEVNFMRRIISRYKRALFSQQSKSIGLKTELKKLLSGSRETIDACTIVDTSSLARQATAEAAAKEMNGNVGEVPEVNEEGITYSQMYSMIESVLCESGYYDVTQTSKLNPEGFHNINRFIP